MNFTKKFTHFKLCVILIIVLLFSPIKVFAQLDSESLDLEDLLPQYNNFNWTYHGSVEYGHDMEINNIIKGQRSTCYTIEGAVYDMSVGEADTDFSINLEYIVQSDAIFQNKEEEAMMDSEYDEIQLIRTPLEKGTTWSQEVEDSDGVATTLESTITDVKDTDKGAIFTVRYEDTNSDYYEQRELQEGVGVISFERLMFSESGSYTRGYSLYEEASGLNIDMNFQDISQGEWYIDYVSELVTLDFIQGYPDQTFRPHEEITVAEFIKVTVESLSYYPKRESDQWFDSYISKAIELGLIEEDEFEEYNRPISREEMTKIIIKALGEEPQSGQLDFTDFNEIEDEFVPYIHTAVELDIIQGYPSDNSFGANKTTSRAEASKLFVLLVEQMMGTESFNEEKAVALEVEFEDRLFQETRDGSWIVEDFKEKEDLIKYITEIANRKLVEAYVDDYYEYMDGELVLPPKDGPTLILEDRDYKLEMIHTREYKLTQETTTEMVGQYTLTIIYRYKNEQWIIHDRDVEV